MLQHFVSFLKNAETESLWGTHPSTATETAVISGRNLEEVRLIKPSDAYGFIFFDQNVVECEDGEVIRGEKKHISGIYYFGKGPFTKEQLLSSENGEVYKERIELLEDIYHHSQLRWHEKKDEFKQEPFAEYFAITDDGEVHPLYHADRVVLSRENDF